MNELTLMDLIRFAEKAKVPLKIDRPGFTRIAIDLEEQLKKPFAAIEKFPLRLGIANVSY